jgi:hypothetical protein
LPVVHRERLVLGAVLGVAALAAAVPAYVFAAPVSVWEPELLLVALTILSFVSYGAAVEVRGSVTLDASFASALVAVVFLGPLPAACIYALPEINGWLARGRVISLFGNTASAFWGTWAAAWTLEALTTGVPLEPGLADLAALAAAGAVLLGVSYLVTTVIVSLVWEGHDLRALIDQEVAELAPAAILLLAVGSATVLLYQQLGPAGLAPLALLVLLPRAVVPWLSKSRDPGKLERSAATLLYARAIAQSLELDSTQRRILLDAATHLGDHKRLTRIEDFERVMQTVLYCGEHWDGAGGFPGVLSGEAIPIESRALAVAEQLAAMTASGTAGLTPGQAIAALVPRAGAEFDPRVLSAARWAIEKEVVVRPRHRPRPARATSAGWRSSRPSGRIRSTRSPSKARPVRPVPSSGAAPTKWQAPRRRPR